MASKKKNNSQKSSTNMTNGLVLSGDAGQDQLLIRNNAGEPVFILHRLAMTEPTLDIDLLRTADAKKDGKPVRLFMPMNVREVQYQLRQMGDASFVSTIRNAAAQNDAEDIYFPKRRL